MGDMIGRPGGLILLLWILGKRWNSASLGVVCVMAFFSAGDISPFLASSDKCFSISSQV